jgi:hypothetical protein
MYLKSYYKDIISFLILVSIGLTFSFNQDRISYLNGMPYDAADYVQMAKQFATGKTIIANKPFVYRTGLPYLVGLMFPDSLLDGFQFINILCGSLTLLLLFALIKQHTSHRGIIFLCGLFWVCNPHAPFRMNSFYPAITDPPALLIISLILLVQIKIAYSFKKVLILIALTFIGVLFREIVLIAAGAIYVVEFVVNRKSADNGKFTQHELERLIVNAMPILGGFMALLLIREHVLGMGKYQFSSHAMMSLYYKTVMNPKSVFAALLMSYGPILAIIKPLNANATILNFIKLRQELFYYFLLLSPLIVIGGFHTDRFFYWEFPFILPFIAYLMDKLRNRYPPKSLLLVSGLILCPQMLAFRVFENIPDVNYDALIDPQEPEFWLLAPYGKNSNFAQMNGAYMSSHSSTFLLLEYAVFFLVIYGVYRFLITHNPQPI